MSWHIVRLTESPAQAWKNGGGLTRELLAWPSASDWRIRLSVADVTANGPFSAFEGVQRWFAVLEGDGVCLTVDGAATELHPTSPPFAFAGDASTDCALLGGPTQDFNLMLRGPSGRLQRVRGQAQGSLAISQPQSAIHLIAAYAIDTSATARFNHDVCLLEPGTLAWRTVDNNPRSSWSLEADNALWMEMTL
jgi:uncharacterized protein